MLHPILQISFFGMAMREKREKRHTDSRSDAADAAWTRNISCHGSSLSSSSSLGCCRLLLHLSVTLPQVEHLDEKRNRSLHFLSTSHTNGAVKVENVREETSLLGAHLDVGSGVYLVHGVTWRTSRLPVQVIALHKHGVVAHAAHPHVALAATLQLHTFTDVQPATCGHVCEVHSGDFIALLG